MDKRTLLLIDKLSNTWLLFPIFLNLCLHEFDVYVEDTITPKWNLGSGPHDLNFKRLYYIRYADEFIIGFTGKIEEVEVIQSDIERFIAETLKLNVNPHNLRIHQSHDEEVDFLGYYLRYLPNVIIRDGKNVEQLKSPSVNSVQLRIPVKILQKQLVDKGMAKINVGDSNSFCARSCKRFISLEDKEIVNRFSSVIAGYTNYYMPADMNSDL